MDQDFFELGEDIVELLGEDGIFYQKGSERLEIRGVPRSKSMRTVAPDTGEYIQTDEYYVLIFEPHIHPWLVSSKDRIEVRGEMFDIVSPHRYTNGLVKIPLVEASAYDGAEDTPY